MAPHGVVSVPVPLKDISPPSPLSLVKICQSKIKLQHSTFNIPSRCLSSLAGAADRLGHWSLPVNLLGDAWAGGVSGCRLPEECGTRGELCRTRLAANLASLQDAG